MKQPKNFKKVEKKKKANKKMEKKKAKKGKNICTAKTSAMSMQCR
jgi:hypothetical protein